MSKPLYRVGILGTGYIADWHARALAAIPSTTIVAVCDQDRAKAESFAQKWGVPSAHQELRQMLEGNQLDVVHVLLPPQTHFGSSKQVLEAGVHVLLEKPMCVTEEECRILDCLAQEKQLTLGVNHNFLFYPIYERLYHDIKNQNLGPLEHVEVTWSKELSQVTFGPYAPWLLQEPQNVLLEVGPHSVAHLLHLIGEPITCEKMEADPITVPGMGTTFRKRQVQGTKGHSTYHLRYQLGSSYSEHTIRIQGRTGAAVVDFENNTYSLQKHTRYMPDIDCWIRSFSYANRMLWQVTRQLFRCVLGKLKLSNKGNPFGYSIQKSLATFYERIGKDQDSRLSAQFATQVVKWCEQIGQAKIAKTSSLKEPSTCSKADILIFGGTGFIGKALMQELIKQGKEVTVFCRNPHALSDCFRQPGVSLLQGDLTRPEQIDAAISDKKVVYHLAKPNASTWKQYLEQDVHPTENIAKSCLKFGVKQLIYTGSIASYYSGKHAGEIDETTPFPNKLECCNPYARSKALSEMVLMRMHEDEKLPVTIFRPGIVLGKGSSPFHWGVGMWKYQSICQLWGDGTNPLPFVLVEDVVRAMVSATDSPNSVGQSFNLVGDVQLSARDYVQELQQSLSASITVIPTSIWRYYLTDLCKWGVKKMIRYPDCSFPYYRDWESRSLKAYYHSQKAQQMLSWSPNQNRDYLIEKGIKEPAEEWLKGAYL